MNSTELSNQEAAGTLAGLLGSLPLALEQAKGYMESTGSSPVRYLSSFQRRQKLVKDGRRLTGTQAILTTTWEISLRQFRKASPAAADLMRLCVFLAPDNIPLDDIRRGSKSLPKTLATAIDDQKLFDQAVNTLVRYAFAKVVGNSFLSTHRAVQEVVRNDMGKHDRKKWAKAAVSIMVNAFPAESDDWRTWPVASILLPHAKEAVSHARRLRVAPEETSLLLTRLGIYSIGRADFPEAKTAFEQALTIDRATHGDDDPRVARDLTNLGFLLKNRGQLDEAQKRFEQALKINKIAYGADHPEVATSLNNLGIVLKDQGQNNPRKLKEAQDLFEQALKIDKAAYGESDPEVARDITNLAFLFKDQAHLEKDESKLKQAKQYFEQALEINKAAYSSYLHRLASSANNFGIILKEEGKWDRARRFFKRALAVDELTYGANHPELAMDISNLAFLMKDQGQLESARGYFERALQISEAAYGPEHPNVAGIVNSLGIVLKDYGDIAGATVHFERALKIFQKFFGEKHPSTVAVMNNLLSVKTHQRQLTEPGGSA